MKWVRLAAAVALAGGVAGSVVTKNSVPLVAAGSVTVGMYLLYAYAKKTGLEQGGAPTESY